MFKFFGPLELLVCLHILTFLLLLLAFIFKTLIKTLEVVFCDRKHIAILLIELCDNIIRLLSRPSKLGEIIYDDDLKRDRGKVEAYESATVALLLIGDKVLADGQDLQSLLLCQCLTAGFPLGKFCFCGSVKIDSGLDIMLEFAGEGETGTSLIDYHLGEYEQALHALDQAIVLAPDFTSPYTYKAEVFAKLRRYEEALSAYDQRIRLDPDHYFAYWEKAEFLGSIGREEDALATYDQFIERRPHIFKGYQWKLFFLTERGRYADGLATCERCLEHNPQLARAHEWKGRMLDHLKRYEEALRCDPMHGEAFLSQARTLVHLERFDEALAACEHALRLAPKSPSAYREKGDILTKQQRYADALQAYQQVVQLKPDDAFAYDQVGDALSKLERFADAVKAYNQAIRLSPDFTRAHSSKAHALAKLGHYEQALAAYNKALQLSPKHFSLLFARAGVLKKLLRYEEANAEYDRAQLVAPHPLLAAGCILASVDLKSVAEAKARLGAAGKAISDETIEAEIDLMYQEQKIVKLKSSPLFQPVSLLMHERQEWSGTANQFKEILCQHSPDAFATWYRSPRKFVDELKEIAPALLDEGIAASVPPDTALVTLSKMATERLQHPE